MSADGRFVAFMSFATNVIPGDANNFCAPVLDPNFSKTANCTDVFVYDRQSGTVELISVNSNGQQFRAPASFPSISADGRYVAFFTGDLPLIQYGSGEHGFYVRDRQTGNTTRLGEWSGRLSADGRHAAYSAERAGDTIIDVYVRDMDAGTNTRVSQSSSGQPANASSFSAAISADGNFVAFSSRATNLVEGDTNVCSGAAPAGACMDVFVHNVATGETVRVSVSSGGVQGNGASGSPSISADGRFVAFRSAASNLVAGDGNNFCDTDFDGQKDDNCQDIFVRDLQTGQTVLASVASSGDQADTSSRDPEISGDGQFVAFLSRATNLVPGDENNVCDNNYDGIKTDNCEDVFVRDLQAGRTDLASVAGDGTQGNGPSGTTSAAGGIIGAHSLSLNGEGSLLAFDSAADNLVPDEPPARGVYVAERLLPSPTPTPGVTIAWGDNDCNGSIAAVDALAALRNVAHLSEVAQNDPCPNVGLEIAVAGYSQQTCGDIECAGGVTAVDALSILRHVAALSPVPKHDPCPNMNQGVHVTIAVLP